MPNLLNQVQHFEEKVMKTILGLPGLFYFIEFMHIYAESNISIL